MMKLAIIMIGSLVILVLYNATFQAEKGFNDSVLLKNGVTLKEVNATATSDSLVVTTKTGETNIYNREEVSGIQWSFDKPRKIQPFLNNWSEYQGRMNWGDALEKCDSLGMRLPTREELKDAHETGLLKSWNKGDQYSYWSSTRNGKSKKPYTLPVLSSFVNDFNRYNKYYVRCYSRGEKN